MSPQPPTPTIADLTLERYRLGELPPAEHARLAAAISADPALRQRLDRLAESDREIRAAYPARVMAASVRQKAGAQAAPTPAAAGARAWLRPAMLAAASVCLMAVAATLWLRQPVPDDTTIKGGPALVLHRKTANGSEALAPGATVREGDQIRVGYRAAGHGYGVIVSIDGRGNLTSHLPRAGDRAVALQTTAGTVFLDFAYELDDAPRWERFYFVTSDSAFDLEPVRQAVRDANRVTPAGPLPLPRTFAHVVFPLSKEQP